MRYLLLLLLLPSFVFASQKPNGNSLLDHGEGDYTSGAHDYLESIKDNPQDAQYVVPAKVARQVIMNVSYKKHKTAIDWWEHTINEQVLQQSNRPNANFTIEVSAASIDVQDYLQMIYEAEGYSCELQPGWDYPTRTLNGKIYLELSW